MRFFVLNQYGQKNPFELLINHLKFFILASNSRAFRIFSEYGQFHSMYYQNTEIFVPRIISIWTISFRVLSINAKFFRKWNTHSAYSQYELNSFLVFSLYAKFHSVYSRYELNFILRFFWDQALIPHVISMRLISFLVLSVLYKLNFIPHTISIPCIRQLQPKKFKNSESNFCLHSF